MSDHSLSSTLIGAVQVAAFFLVFAVLGAGLLGLLVATGKGDFRTRPEVGEIAAGPGLSDLPNLNR